MSPAGLRSRFAPLTPPPAVGALSVTPADAAASDEPACVTCGRPAGTPFCPHCGERRAADHAYTLRAIVADAWDHVTPADGKSLRSIWTLGRWPGALTAAYMRGVRQPYLSPLRLFLFVNAAYFAYASLLHQHVFSTPLESHVRFGFYHDLARRMVDARLAARGVAFDAYAQRFDAVVETQAKTLLVSMVPMFAGVVAAVQVGHRRPALHHLAFGFHALAAMLCLFMGPYTLVVVPFEVALQSGIVRLGPLNRDFVTSAPLMLMLWAWLVLGVRRAYGDGHWEAVAKATALLVAFFYVLTTYRALLFFTAFWAT